MGILVELYDHSYLSIPLADFYQIFFLYKDRDTEMKKKPKQFCSAQTFFFAYLLTQISNIQITKNHIQSRRQQ